VEDVNKAPQCAMQFVIAEKEELFDNRDHALKAYQRFTGGVGPGGFADQNLGEKRRGTERCARDRLSQRPFFGFGHTRTVRDGASVGPAFEQY
jgi:hypothetical protein